MSDNWSELEVKSIIEVYFDMLRLELNGEKYNKSEHRRALVKRLDSRSEGAIERKHANISHVLIELGMPYINGYKPYKNIQHILRGGVADYLRDKPDINQVLLSSADEPVFIPKVDDILSTLVDPPVKAKPDNMVEDKEGKYLPEVNYLEREERNISVGNAGEQFVLNFEKARLIHAGRENLADRIEQVSVTQGPTAGYDILSFELDGSDRYIETKATKYGKYTPIFFSKNELSFSEANFGRYFLYRVFQVSKEPKLFHLKGSLSKSFAIEPVSFIGKCLE